MSLYHDGRGAQQQVAAIQGESMSDERNTYIGGSEVFELLNCAQYGSGCVRKLAFDKLGYEKDFPETDNDLILRRGNLLECVAADLYQQQTGRKLRRVASGRKHPCYSWASVSTDRTIQSGGGNKPGGGPGDLELKTRSEGPFRRVQRLGPFDGDLLQIQWSLWITGHAWGALGILGVFGELPLLHFDVEPDRELHSIFEYEGAKFNDIVFVQRQLPEPPFPATDSRCRVCCYRLSCRGELADDTEVQALREVNKSKHELVQINNPALVSTLTDVDLLRSEIKSLETALDIAKETAQDQLGDVDSAYLANYGKVYRLVSQVKRIDVERLKTELPTIYAKYVLSYTTGSYLRCYPHKG